MSKGLYRTRLQVLYAGTVLPGTMALLASLLSLVFLAYATTWRSVFGIVLAGYFAHLGSKVCLLMGQNDYMPPLVAGWFVPLALAVAACVVILAAGRRQRGKEIPVSVASGARG